MTYTRIRVNERTSRSVDVVYICVYIYVYANFICTIIITCSLNVDRVGERATKYMSEHTRQSRCILLH